MVDREAVELAADEAKGMLGGESPEKPKRTKVSGTGKWKRTPADREKLSRAVKEAAARRKAAGGGSPETVTEAPRVPPSPEECKAYGKMGGAVWLIVGKFAKLRALTEDEEFQLGSAMAPVAQKWIPTLDKWKEEITLVVVTMTLYQATRIVEDQPKPEEVREWKEQTPLETMQ